MKKGRPRILLVKLSAIGDVVHTLPALNAIRHHYPQAHLTWLVEEGAADLVVGHPALDRVLVSKRKSWIQRLKTRDRWSAVREILRLVQEVRDTRYDMAIDFQSLLKSGFWIGVSRANRKIGFDKGMQHQEHSYLFLNERIPPVDMEVHALTRGLHLVRALGAHTEGVAYRISVTAEDRQRVKTLLVAHGIEQTRPLVAINPIALWKTKLWIDDRFAKLADRLIQELGVQVVFTGGPGDRPVIDAIMAQMTCTAANLAGQTSLKMAAALYRQAALLVSTDTGPMHIAAAVGTKVVALFGPTAPWRTGPFGTGHRVVRTDIACSPCFKRRCERHGYRCMRDITVEQVIEAVRELLDHRNSDNSDAR